MLTSIVVSAHQKTISLIHYYHLKKDYSYRSAPLHDEYENNILLNEDDDFDEEFSRGIFSNNEEMHAPRLLT